MEQELLPTTQEGISRNDVELEMLRTVPETNTGTRSKDSNYRGYQMVQDPPPPYTPTQGTGSNRSWISRASGWRTERADCNHLKK